MRRGTTPTLTFTLPFDASGATMLSVAFAQRAAYAQEPSVVLEKTLVDVSFSEDGKTITLPLSEADTLALDSRAGVVEIQLRLGIGTRRLASEVICTSVGAILKDGALS